MATAVIMPRQGQSVESCIINEWKKQVGDSVAEGDILCDVETDKATLEVPSPVSGTLLATFFGPGDDVPVLMTIAAVGAPGEDVSGLAPASATSAPATATQAAPAAAEAAAPVAAPSPAAVSGGSSPVSPRARTLAEKRGLEASALAGSGPGGRVIERDVVAALAAQPRLTPVAKAMLAEGGFTVPQQGSGPGGRVTSKDLMQAGSAPAAPAAPAAVPATPQPVEEGEVTQIVVKGVRKLIAERMLASLQTTAQLTMNAYADARALQALRKRLKESPEALGLRGITINDLVLFAVARALRQHPDVNALFADNLISQYRSVHLGFAVDTPRGLLVPVIRNAHTLSLRAIAAEAKRLSTAAIDGKSAPDDLQGGTFTVTNLGGFGVETFTPVLNPPQVAILGVGGINLRPLEAGGDVKFVPHIGLSLTINHQVVDGAPGARFLQTVAQSIATIDLLLAG